MVVFRPDLAPEAGLGHFARCAAVAEAVVRGGGRALFVADAAGAAPARAAGWEVREALPPSADDPLGVLGVLPGGASALVVDSYRVTGALLARLRERVPLVVIDDLAETYAPADLVVNGAAHAPGLAYDRAAVGAVLAGPRYMLLRGVFAEPVRRNGARPLRRALLATGGGDPAGVMPRLLREVRAALPAEVEIDVVVGPYFPAEWRAAETSREWAGRGVHLHDAPADLRPLMLGADLAVTAAGLALYELAATGVPVVAFSIAPNQRPQLAVLAAAGALRSAGDAGEPEMWGRLGEHLAALRDAPAERAALAAAARGVVDGRGAARVAEALARLPRGGR
jgi:spore coat polysaccharide biosynthesis predicted glycosyltransferase SpsG